ncbi:carboxypeptidase M32 [Coprothermobacter platensis]|uniref:carboxypeptidase M32 n=1 Tax=Coprothermobacter platensis TaxID=108819 RepID=UPI000475FF42
MKVNHEEKISEIKSYMRKIELFGHALGVLSWDLEVNVPPGGVKGRSEVLGYLSGEMYKLMTDHVVGDYISWMEQENLDDPVEKAMLREMKKSYERLVKIPIDRYVAFSSLTSEAQAVWADARQRNDYEAFKPYLKQIIDFEKEFVGYLGYKENKYDTLLDEYEPGMTTAVLDKVFSELRDKLVALLRRLQEQGKEPDRRFLAGNYPTEKQKELNHKALQLMGFDFQRGRVDISAHPFTTSFFNGDVRITNRYDESYFLSSLFSAMHEGGHGLYEQDISDSLYGTGLATGVSMGIHESQSRFYENMIGRSKGFWQFFYDTVIDVFPNLKNATAEDIYKAVNTVEPSLIRTEADELTYAMHIIIRYEMEKAFINDEITVDEAPEVWNDKYEKYLGIRPSDNKDGILQDTHWAGGMIGYFPSYALGNLYAAQFLKAMKKDIDVDELLKKGDLNPIHEWLKEKVHKHGSVYTPSELVQMVTGEPLNPQYFVDYLTTKLEDVYNIK